MTHTGPQPARRRTRVARAMASLATATALVAGGLIYSTAEVPAPAAAEPCIPGSSPTCPPGPQPTGPTSDPTGGQTTAPQAPTTTAIPGQQPTEAPSEPTPNQGGNGMNVQTPNQPATTNPNGIFGPTQNPAPTGQPPNGQAPTQGTQPTETQPPGEQPSTTSQEKRPGTQQQKCALALRQLGVASSVGSGWTDVQPSDPDPKLVATICDGNCNVQIKGPDQGKKNKDTKQCPAGSHADEDSDSKWNPWDEDDCKANYDLEITRIVRKNCDVPLGTPAIDWTQGPHKIKRGIKVGTSLAVENSTSLAVALGAEESAGGGVKLAEIGGKLTQQVTGTVSRTTTSTNSAEESLESELDVPAGETWGTFPVTCMYDVSIKSVPANGFSGPEKTTVIGLKGQPGTTWVGKANRGGGYAGPAGVSGGRG